jgi:hypothetical protein
MSQSHRPHSFSSSYSRVGWLQVGLRASHSAIIVLRFVLHKSRLSPASCWIANTHLGTTVLSNIPTRDFNEHQKAVARGVDEEWEALRLLTPVDNHGTPQGKSKVSLKSSFSNTLFGRLLRAAQTLRQRKYAPVARLACAMAGVCANSRARCRAGSCMWMARQRKAALVHCGLCEHVPQRLRAPM